MKPDTNTTNNAKFADALVDWYRHECRPFLEGVAGDRLQQLDQDIVRLENVYELLLEDLPLCFLGNSGVGKSTLINAVLAGRDVLLPAGGVGPLTAEATVVRHATERMFSVTYHPAAKLNNILFALERAHEKEVGKRNSASAPDGASPADASMDDIGDLGLLEVEAPSVSTSPESSTTGILAVLARQVAQLVRGDQYAPLDRGYALDCLRACMNLPLRWDTTVQTEDEERIFHITQALSRARDGDGTLQIRAADSESVFRMELERHAAGFLAPLIRKLEVGWESALLGAGLVLVDLPGVGVANDDFRRVTSHWIRQARGVVLVVDRSGLSEASAELLRTSGFLNSLMHESHDSEQLSIHLMIAVVKLDSTADDARAREKLANPSMVRSWATHFDEACEKAISMVREQLGVELQKVSAMGGESTREERDRVLARVLERTQVHPVVAPEYRKFLAQDDDDRPKIKSAEQSRIPAFERALIQIAQERSDLIDARLEFLGRNVHERLRGVLDLVHARSKQETEAHQQQTHRIQHELESFAQPLRTEIANRQGEFREFLRSTIPKQITARVDAGAEAARNDIVKHLRRYERYHWGTLRAAVRRGGAYIGSKAVDLPADITLLFEEPVAIVWSKYILRELRAKTAGIGAEYVQIVGELVKWGHAHEQLLDPQVLDAMHRELQAEVGSLGTVGREAIDELKAAVKGELYDRVESAVRERCRDFVERNADRGAGVKDRILELFRALGDVVVDAARPIANDVLMRHYGTVEGEIRSAFDKYRNPVDVAVEELIRRPPQLSRASDLQKQREVMLRAGHLLNSIPFSEQFAPKAAEATS
jgi:hypothetical protein